MVKEMKDKSNLKLTIVKTYGSLTKGVHMHLKMHEMNER